MSGDWETKEITLRLEGVPLHPIPFTAQHLPIGVFIAYCKTGAITDYLGTAYYGTLNYRADCITYPSVLLDRPADERFTHITWFSDHR